MTSHKKNKKINSFSGTKPDGRLTNDVTRAKNPDQTAINTLELKDKTSHDNDVMLSALKKKKCHKNGNENRPSLRQSLKIRTNVVSILNNSTAVPFSYTKSKFNCFMCHEGFSRSDELRNHYVSQHASSKLSPIDETLKKLNKNSTLKLDMTELFCKLCHQHFSSTNLLIDHLTSNHDIKYDKTIPDVTQSIKIYDDDLRCHICDEKFLYFVKLIAHMNETHEDKKYVCDVCGKSFKEMSSYNLHIWNHGPGHNCPDCGRRCANPYSLKEHMASVHGKGKYKCPECNEEFASNYKRKKHVISEHNTGTTSFPCTHCDKIFAWASQRNIHIRKIHLQEKNEVCPICHALLFNKTRLRLHMVKHLRERNHVCDICGKKYQWKKNLKKHMQQAHNVT